MTYCCATMRSNVERRCDQHPDPFDCPDTVIWQSALGDQYGLMIHNGGRSYVTIAFCPWCGTRLGG
jgi:hypothetical protein